MIGESAAPNVEYFYNDSPVIEHNEDQMSLPLEVFSGTEGDLGLIPPKAEGVSTRDHLLQLVLRELASSVVMLDGTGIVTWSGSPVEKFVSEVIDTRPGSNYLSALAAIDDGNDLLARKALAGIKSVLSGKLPNFTLEYPRIEPMGRRWFIMSVVSKGRSPNGNHGVVICCSDITQMRQDNEALEDAHAEIRKLKSELDTDTYVSQEEIRLAHDFGETVGSSESLKKVLRLTEQVAPTDTTVLIHGETGTGKELLASAIHKLSLRKDRPLIIVNCAALPSTLIESELFGHEKGAFTGASNSRAGRFETANGATIFLDEIGELPLELQSKLLRVLQECEFERLGSSKTIKIDVRVIAATNRELRESVNRGEFRADLYYRLSVFPIRVPPLRERKDDIPLLVNFFVQGMTRKLGKQITIIPQDVHDILQNYDWPGNVRELKNVIERTVIVSIGTRLAKPEGLVSSLDFKSEKSEKEEADAKARVSDETDSTGEPAKFITALEDVQRDHILRVLDNTYWRVEGPNGAAAILGINPGTLRSRMKRLGIHRPGIQK